MDNINYNITPEDLKDGKSPKQVIREREIVGMVDRLVHSYFLEVYGKEYPKEFKILIASETIKMNKVTKDSNVDLNFYQFTFDGLAQERRKILDLKYHQEIEEMAVEMIVTLIEDLNRRYSKEAN